MTTEPQGGDEPAPGALVELRRALAESRGRKRLDLLIDQPDPRSAIQSLPADELYHAIHEAGLADAADVVELASPEQFRTFIDLDAWRGGEVEPLRLLPWLRAARGASSGKDRDDDLDAWREKLAALDPEVVSLLFRTALRIHDLEEDPDPDLEGERFVRTPEGSYILEFLPDGIDYETTRRIVDDLYERDPFLAGRILSAIRWEVTSDLEEQALRWRDARLADLGYPTFEEALSWFARPARRSPSAAGMADRPPGFWLVSFRRGTLLDRAAAELPPAAAERLDSELLAAANASLVADRVDPSDPEQARGTVESARTLIELGLEKLSGGEVEAAAKLLAATPLKVIFQNGFGELLALRASADRIVREAGAHGSPLPRLDPPFGEAFEAVRRRRPRYFPGLASPRDEWGSPVSGAFDERPFRSAEEVRSTSAALAEGESLLALGRLLGLTPPATTTAPAPTLAALYLTSLVNERLGRRFAPEPIPAGELPSAARAVEKIEDPRLTAAGAAGELLRTLAQNRSAELAPLRAGEPVVPGAIDALLVAG